MKRVQKSMNECITYHSIPTLIWPYLSETLYSWYTLINIFHILIIRVKFVDDDPNQVSTR